MTLSNHHDAATRSKHRTILCIQAAKIADSPHICCQKFEKASQRAIRTSLILTHRAGGELELANLRDGELKKVKLKSDKQVDQELPTVINVLDGLPIVGNWRQSPPIDFSNPEIHWHTWGFKGISYFALKLAIIPQNAVSISISGQYCDGKTCAGASDLRFRIPPPQDSHRNPTIQRILNSLMDLVQAE